MRHTKDIIILILVSMVFPVFFYSVFGILYFIIPNPTFYTSDWLLGILEFWFTDLIGILTIFPFIMALYYYIGTIKDWTYSKLNDIAHKIPSFLTNNWVPILVVFSIPFINQLTVVLFTEYGIELFYFGYLPCVWFGTQYDIKITSICITFANVSFFIQRNQEALNSIEFQFLIFIFTLVALLFSAKIGENKRILNRTISSLEDSNVELEQTNRELQISNTELQQFAYVASHDLQEPLRAITGYLQLFVKKYGDYPDEKGEKYVNGVIDAAERMERMINDLLTFSRIGTKNKEFAMVDLNQVLDEVLQNLSSKIENSNAIVEIESLPLIYGNEVQLMQLFQNLISNSIKYCDTVPHVTISTEQKHDDVIIAVQDNGIGISSDYFDKIFIIFQRLHSKHEYEGSGIGLAICKKIVQRHKGKIWVDAEEGSGSTFYVSFPLRGDMK